MVITLLQGIVFILYVSFIVFKFGILSSISDSWYKLSFNEKGLFWLFCILLGLGMFFQGGIWFQISGIGIWVTGTMAPFKHNRRFIQVAHFIGAGICIFSALLGLWIDRGIFISLMIFGIIVGAIQLFKVDNKTFWIECAAFVCIIGGLLFHPLI